MSFPVSFSSQLAAIMDALLKAVVVEVTALVEDGAAELRLELREKDREIRDKHREMEENHREIEENHREIEENHREIEENHREIQELRAAVELLKAREEAAVSPVRSGEVEKQTENCQIWTKEEEDTPQTSDMSAMVKCEPTEEFSTTSSSTEPHLVDNEMYGQSYQSYEPQINSTSEDADDFLHWGQEQFEPQTLPLDTAPVQHISEDHLNLTNLKEAGLSLFPPVAHLQNEVCSKNNKRIRRFNTKRLNHIESGPKTGFRCDQCGKCFKQRRRLITHQSVHTGLKPFSCRTCGKKFSRSDSCVRHERSGGGCRF